MLFFVINWWIIFSRLNTIRTPSLSSFSSLILHAVNFLIWKKIITVSRTATLRQNSWGVQYVLLSDGTGEGEWRSPCKPKSLNFPLLLDKNITYWGKKDIFDSFYISFNTTVACSLHSVRQLWLIWKSSIKTKSLKILLRDTSSIIGPD